MTQSPEHTHFTLQRLFATSPTHAFRFWSEPDLKDRWNGCHPDWAVEEDVFDFRPGGQDRKRWRTKDGQVQTYTAHYLDIVPGQRLIYAYEMSFAEQRLSASLVTIQLSPAGKSCRMTYTEQVVILSGGPDARLQRLMGTEQGIDRLKNILAGQG